MRSDRVAVITRWLAILLVAVYTIVGFVGLFADIEPTRDRVIFVVLLWGGAFLVLAGLATFASSRWLSAVLVSAGAAAGALAMFWSILVPVAAIALAVLSVIRARQPDTPPAAEAP